MIEDSKVSKTLIDEKIGTPTLTGPREPAVANSWIPGSHTILDFSSWQRENSTNEGPELWDGLRPFSFQDAEEDMILSLGWDVLRTWARSPRL